jgi:hypothetical protein
MSRIALPHASPIRTAVIVAALVVALAGGVLLGFVLDRTPSSVPTAGSVGGAAQGTDRLYGGEAERYLDWLNEQGAKYR